MSLRIYELAKEFGVDSKSVIKVLKNNGENVKSHLSSIDSDIGRKIVKEALIDKVEDVIEEKVDEILEPIVEFIPDDVEEKVEEIVSEVINDIEDKVEDVKTVSKKIIDSETSKLVEMARINKAERRKKLDSGLGFFSWLFSLLFNRK